MYMHGYIKNGFLKDPLTPKNLLVMLKMVLHFPSSSLFPFSFSPSCSSHETSSTKAPKSFIHPTKQSNLAENVGGLIAKGNKAKPLHANGLCPCGRRHFFEAAATAALLPVLPSKASDKLQSDNYMDILNKFHPKKPDWYEELYASLLNSATKAYEAEIAVYKSQLLANLRGNAKKIVEIGIGTGPNLKYYAANGDMQVFGVDPNKKMEKYAQEAAAAAGLPPANFKFIHAVGESIPLSDASVDAVIGTLVLCSVKDVDLTLQEVKRVLKAGGMYIFVEHVAAEDGTPLKFLQRVLDPLQQAVADGCHLTRETGKRISEAGFSSIDLSKAFFSTTAFINPQVYGIARK